MRNRKVIACFPVLAIFGFLLIKRNIPDRLAGPETHLLADEAEASGIPMDRQDSDAKPSKLPRPQSEDSADKFIRAKLKSITIPTIAFEETSVEEAIDFLRVRSIELDRTESDPARKGISFLIRKPSSEDSDLMARSTIPGSSASLTLQARDISLWDALHLVAREADLKVEITDRGIELQSP